MPYKSEKIQIEGTKLDRRIKLSPEQKDKIASLRGTISARGCARIYEVDKRTIQFIWYPERLERNKQLRQERGGWKQYYDKIKWRETMKEHRNYKQELFLEGKIKPSRYNHDNSIAEGHILGQVPEHWIMLKEIEILTEDK